MPERLSARVAALLVDNNNEITVSAVTAYELEFKRTRDPEMARLPADLNEAVEGQRFAWLPISHEHATLAGRLPRLHGDPFDRLLIAQSMLENATIVSVDRWFPAYGAPVIW